MKHTVGAQERMDGEQPEMPIGCGDHPLGFLTPVSLFTVSLQPGMPSPSPLSLLPVTLISPVP